MLRFKTSDMLWQFVLGYSTTGTSATLQLSYSIYDKSVDMISYLLVIYLNPKLAGGVLTQNTIPKLTAKLRRWRKVATFVER